MTLALFDVEVVLNGKPRMSNHAFWHEDGRGISADLDFATVDILGWSSLNGTAWLDRTDPDNTTASPANALEAVLYFHRCMQHASGQIKGVYLRSAPHDSYLTAIGVSKRLNVSCGANHLAIALDDLESMNNTLQIAKTTITIGGDGGMLYLRGALSKESTVGDGNDGVMLQDVNVPLYDIAMRSALGVDDGGSGKLSDFFGAYPVDTSTGKIYYVVMSTAESAVVKTRRGNPKRYASGYEVVQNFEIVDATDRNTRRRAVRGPVVPAEGV